jgi:hypothetical protein
MRTYDQEVHPALSVVRHVPILGSAERGVDLEVTEVKEVKERFKRHTAEAESGLR